jgi:hypothetical protein
MTRLNYSKASQYSAIKSVLARLDNVAELSHGWSARCPCHDDNDPVLKQPSRVSLDRQVIR